MSTIAISDEVKTKLEDIARHLNISKEEVIESGLAIFEAGLRRRTKTIQNLKSQQKS
ncbi:MAG: hypothetical protein C5S38_09945 [Candidatus Methanophagaceae archaeon]|jgi:predicted transcriptional regulator|nr:MAG: hypothetical protein C5S38_09945 [Methanophagales archaeon]